MPPQFTPEQLAARKAEIEQQQKAALRAITDSEIALHSLADKLHNAAFAAGKTPSYADSLREAARRIIQARQEPSFPQAALDNLLRYAPAAAAAVPGNSGAPADAVAAAEHAAEAAPAPAAAS